MSSPSTRQHILHSADQLFYQQGYEHTSFAHIAEAVGISRGNFYHHFKSKDELLDAVIDQRLSNTRQVLAEWEHAGDNPRARIRSFIHILVVNQSKIMRYGCPVGTLCSELAKLGHASRGEANRLFTLFQTWLREQFRQLGLAERADELALHLLARSQGVATLGQAFHDAQFIDREVEQMCDWLDAQIPTDRRR